MHDLIYFDNAATTKICDESLSVYNKYSKDLYFNPSSAYTPAVKIERKIINAKKCIIDFIGADGGKIIFTSGGTESDNLAIIGASLKTKKRHIITSATEHPAVIKTCKYLKDEKGFDLTFLPVDSNGQVSTNDLKRAISSDTFLISIMHVNNETGAIQNIKELCKTAKDINKDILFHSDGVQAYGKIDINIDELNIDMYSLNAHKIHGPKGIGALYIKDASKINSIMFGGGQEDNIRPGTYNHPGILAFCKALEISKYNENNRKIKDIKRYLIDNITKKIPDTLIISKNYVNFCDNIINIAFKNINAETLLHSTQYKNLIISTGSACTSRRKIVSSTLKNMQIDKDYINGAIRISISAYNTLDEAEKAVEILDVCVNKLREYT